jgi:hypothetical protein
MTVNLLFLAACQILVRSPSNIHDRSIRAVVIKSRAFGAPLSGFRAWPLSAVEQIAARAKMPDPRF